MNFRKRDLRIGIDFDNTIVNYDDLFYQAALEKRMITSGIEISKRCCQGIRFAIWKC